MANDDTQLPAPPVPPDTDLRHFDHMPLNVQRLRDSALSGMDGEVFKIAVLSWCASWHQVPAGSLPDGVTDWAKEKRDTAASATPEHQLARLLGLGSSTRRLRQLVHLGAMRGWSRHSDGRLYHPVVTEVVAAAVAKSSRQANNAKLRKTNKPATTVAAANPAPVAPATTTTVAAATSTQLAQPRIEGNRREKEPLINPPLNSAPQKPDVVDDGSLIEQLAAAWPPERFNLKLARQSLWSARTRGTAPAAPELLAAARAYIKASAGKQVGYVLFLHRWIDTDSWTVAAGDGTAKVAPVVDQAAMLHRCIRFKADLAQAGLTPTPDELAAATAAYVDHVIAFNAKQVAWDGARYGDNRPDQTEIREALAWVPDMPAALVRA